MAKIPRAAIKKLVKSYFDVNITDRGADALARMLEKEAEKISRFAVENAKRENGGKVTRKDISKYIISRG